MNYEFYMFKSWIYIPVIIVGLLGNFASFMVYRTRPMRRSTVGTLLLLVSFIDIILLILVTPIFVLIFLPIWEDPWAANSFHMRFLTYSTRFAYPLCMMTKSCSLYFMVLITIERWIAVCRPLQAKFLCTNRNTIKAGISIVIFSIVFNFPRFFDYKFVNGRMEMWMLDTEQNWWYFAIYFVILSVIFDYLLPFLIMTIANYHVIQALRQRDDEAVASLAVQKRKEQNTTVMLLVVTIFFAFCHLFGMFLKIAECIFGGFLTQKSFYWEVFAEFTTFLIVFHTSSTFFIYYAFSEKFRLTFRKILRCQRESSSEETKCFTYGAHPQVSGVSDAKRKSPVHL